MVAFLNPCHALFHTSAATTCQSNAPQHMYLMYLRKAVFTGADRPLPSFIKL